MEYGVVKASPEAFENANDVASSRLAPGRAARAVLFTSKPSNTEVGIAHTFDQPDFSKPSTESAGDIMNLPNTSVKLFLAKL